jgi:hypothetical protein
MHELLSPLTYLTHSCHWQAYDDYLCLTRNHFHRFLILAKKFWEMTWLHVYTNRKQSNHHIFRYHICIAYHSLRCYLLFCIHFVKSFGCQGRHAVNYEYGIIHEKLFVRWSHFFTILLCKAHIQLSYFMIRP